MRLVPLALAAALAAPAFAQVHTCTSALAGLGCGASLSVTFTAVGQAGNHDLRLDVSGLHPDAWGLMVFGDTPAVIPLPSGCTLWTAFLWGHTIKSDALGEFSWSRSWPASANAQYYIQFGSFVLDASGNLELRASDCHHAECH